MSLEDLEKRLKDFQGGSFEKKPFAKKKGKEDKDKKESEPLSERILEIEEDIDERHRWLKKTLLVGSGLAVVILGLGLFFIFSYTASSRDVNLEISAISDVSRGAPFTVDVSVTNNSGGLIKNATITLNLPQGVIAPDSGRDRSLITENVGDLSSGNLVKRTYTLIPVDPVGSKETIMANLAYAIATGARFEIYQSQDEYVKDSAIEIDLVRPDQILSGSNFAIKVNYKNKSNFNFPSLTLEADYPSAFKFDSASVLPASLNNYWQLGGLGGNATGTLSISGHLDLSAGTNVTVPVKMSVNFGGQDYPVADGLISLSPSASPIALQILVNGQSDYTASAGDDLKYSVRYQNSSGIALADAKIVLTLVGEMIDWKSLKTNGAFDQGAQTITWNSSNLPALKTLDPGAGGEVDFEVHLNSLFNLQSLSDRNFSVRLDAVMSSPSVPYYLSSKTTSVEAASEVKLSGLALVLAQGYFRDAGSGILNKGDLPPESGKATQYTVHWLIKNFSNDLNNVEVKATLAPGVKWVAAGSANLGNPVVYNPGDNSVTWDIDQIGATKGILSDPAEAVFQVEATPDDSMVGAPETLIGTSYLTATDNFTGQALSTQAAPVTTDKLGDISSQAEGVVIQ